LNFSCRSGGSKGGGGERGETAERDSRARTPELTHDPTIGPPIGVDPRSMIACRSRTRSAHRGIRVHLHDGCNPRSPTPGLHHVSCPLSAKSSPRAVLARPVLGLDRCGHRSDLLDLQAAVGASWSQSLSHSTGWVRSSDGRVPEIREDAAFTGIPVELHDIDRLEEGQRLIIRCQRKHLGLVVVDEPFEVDEIAIDLLERPVWLFQLLFPREQGDRTFDRVTKDSDHDSVGEMDVGSHHEREMTAEQRNARLLISADRRELTDLEVRAGPAQSIASRIHLVRREVPRQVLVSVVLAVFIT
jgi:hypothetical protein